MTDVPSTLRSIAKRMDEEYVRTQEAQSKATKERGERSHEAVQLGGRLDILARWAARLREMAAKEEFVPPKPWSECHTPEDQGNARPCTDEEARARHEALNGKSND